MEATNIFVGGLNKDNDFLFQPKNTYVDCLNMRLVSNGENSFSLESIKGNSVTFSVASGYRPIGWGSLRDKLIVFSTNGYQNSPGKINVVVLDNSATVISNTEIYSSADLNFGFNYPIFDVVSNHENSETERVYWTDNHNPPRVINILDPNVGTIAAGSLEFVPNNNMGQIDFKEYTTDGDLPYGVTQYAYRLRSSSGIVTSWSYLSREVEMAKNQEGGTGITNIRYYQTYQGAPSAVGSLLGIIMTISGIDTSYDFIDVVAFSSAAYNVTGDGTIIFVGAITGASMDITHRGNETLGTVTVQSLNTSTLAFRTVKTLESIKARLSAGNVTMYGDVDYDPLATGTSVTLAPLEYLVPADSLGRPDDSGESAASSQPSPLVGVKVQPSTGVVSGNILPNGKYIVKSAGLAGTITYNAVVYTVGQTFVGVSGVTAFTAGGDGKVKAIIKIQKFTGAYKIIELEDDFFDLKGMASSHYLKSYWRSETYRIGFLPYDLKGNPLYVRWLGDFPVPSQNASSPFDCSLLKNENNTNYSLRIMGLKVSGIDISDIADQISGFSIVRCVRDAQVLAQGVLFPAMQDYGGDANVTRPLAGPSIGFDKGYENGKDKEPGCYTLFTPEHLFGWDDFPNLVTGDHLVINEYLNERNVSPYNGMGEQETQNFHAYQKFYEASNGSSGALAPGSECTISSFATVGGQGASITPYGSGGKSFTNASIIHSAAGAYGDRTGVGCPLMILDMTGTNATNFGSFGDVNNIDKPTVNWVRTNDNLYGGTSDAAKASNTYIHCGHFQEVNSTVFAANGSSWVFNNIEVFGGDAFVTIFDYARMVKDWSLPALTTLFSHALIFPVETNVNTNLRQSNHIARDRSYEDDSGSIFNTSGIGKDGGGVAERFTYNDAYSTEEDSLFYVALPVAFANNKQFESRAIYTNAKINGELIDSWRFFLTNQFKDLDSVYGGITNLRKYNDRLYYWQERSTGYIPVNEQTLVSGSVGTPTQMGIGGVFEIFVQLSNFYGNQHQGSLTRFDGGLMWFDMRKRSMLIMTGGEPQDVSTPNGMLQFFQNAFLDSKPYIQPTTLYKAGQIIQDPDGSPYVCILSFTTGGSPTNPSSDSTHWLLTTNDNPILSNGICGGYDNRFKEVLMCFTDPVNGNFMTTFSIFKGVNRFIAKYSLQPTVLGNYNNLLISAAPMLPAIVNSTAYAIGDSIRSTVNSSNYVCILGYTSAGSAIDPSADATHWALSSACSQVFAHNMNDICKFYGIVYDNYVEFIVNDNYQFGKVFDNLEVTGSNEAFTDYDFNTDTLTASDQDIDSVSNKDYELRFGAWLSSFPLTATKERLNDQFVRIKLRKDNRDGDPRTSKNIETKITSVKTLYRILK